MSPCEAHSAAFFARPWETPNSSRTAAKERSNSNMVCVVMTSAIVRCANKWIYQRTRREATGCELGLLNSPKASSLSTLVCPTTLEIPSRNLPESVVLTSVKSLLILLHLRVGHTVPRVTQHNTEFWRVVLLHCRTRRQMLFKGDIRMIHTLSGNLQR